MGNNANYAIMPSYINVVPRNIFNTYAYDGLQPLKNWDMQPGTLMGSTNTVGRLYGAVSSSSNSIAYLLIGSLLLLMPPKQDVTQESEIHLCLGSMPVHIFYWLRSQLISTYPSIRCLWRCNTIIIACFQAFKCLRILNSLNNFISSTGWHRMTRFSPSI